MKIQLELGICPYPAQMARLFTEVHGRKMSQWPQIELGRFQMDIQGGKSMRMIKQWDRLPREELVLGEFSRLK